VRILGIETSTRRGTVALVEHGQPIVALAHDEAGAHAERVVGLVEEALAQAGWTKQSIDRVGVGVGPGSFTGIRVGIALAQGISLGLDLPLVGVESLKAMARAVPRSTPGLRCALVDARRGEVFMAAYEPDGATVLAPVAVPRQAALGRLAELCPGQRILLGEVLAELGGPPHCAGPLAALPHASCVAMLAGESPVPNGPVVPLYARDADAARPDLGPNPLAFPFRGDEK
jgi:tRNA threonylcarbamoyladenosine biosynthesis protein TsaB